MTHCLKAAAGSNPAIATDFYYGTDGLRRQKIAVTAGNATPVVTNSVLDNGMLLRETNGSGQSVATYLVGARGPECKRDDARGGLARWYVFDGMGSVVGEVDPNGNVTTARNLDVYGAARGTTYTASGEKPSKQAFVGSLGHTTDEETGGLVYMRARYMDTVRQWRRARNRASRRSWAVWGNREVHIRGFCEARQQLVHLRIR